MTLTQEKEHNSMYKFPKVFRLIALSALILTACKSEPKKEATPIVEKMQGIVSRQGDKIIVTDCNSNRFITLPLSALDSLGASPYAVVSFTTDSLNGERTVINLDRTADSQLIDCKRDVKHIGQLHQNQTVIAVDNKREVKLTIHRDRIEVQLASGEVIPFSYIDAGVVQDKYVLRSSTLSSDFQSELRIIVSSFPVSEVLESFHFHCIIELDKKRMEGIYNF